MKPAFTATISTSEPHTLKVHVGGELTFGNAEDLDALIAEQLLRLPEVRDLFIDCADVAAVDSMGLSVLLMVKRRAQQANAQLHLDNRPARLERMLTLTGTYAHFTGQA
ncbi:STAS domain-containing protein [Kibdelosporangium phytohabitans]|uniref:STAS domain-containing protein n=1 Tax=Kibdelosporangium phytohabitans TaxID=860235 RepID=A0A0N9IBY4_9PSEU|nr:STAS domain-containing protein [Kibdelosporangium phytohabitans]ALG12036.1 hypothetical protein AOZ06_38830 [Kibdelosporangium phytohabitans]